MQDLISILQKRSSRSILFVEQREGVQSVRLNRSSERAGNTIWWLLCFPEMHFTI